MKTYSIQELEEYLSVELYQVDWKIENSQTDTKALKVLMEPCNEKLLTPFIGSNIFGSIADSFEWLLQFNATCVSEKQKLKFKGSYSSLDISRP